MTNDLFTKADLDQMKQLGITEEEAGRQKETARDKRAGEVTRH